MFSMIILDQVHFSVFSSLEYWWYTAVLPIRWYYDHPFPTFFFPPLYDLNILQGSYLCYFGRVPCFYFCRINCKMLFKLLKVPHLMKMEKCHSPFHIFFLVNPHHLTSHSSLGFLKFQCWVSSHFRFPV